MNQRTSMKALAESILVAGPGGGRPGRGGLTCPKADFVTRSEPFTPSGHRMPPFSGHVFITDRLTAVHA